VTGPDRRRLASGVTAIAVVVIRSSVGRATTPPDAVQFAWVRAPGAESCPDGAAIARDVVRRLGRDPFGADAPRRIEGVVARDGARWIARVYFRDTAAASPGARELDSAAPDCGPISAAVALAIVLDIDPDAPTTPAPAPVPPPVVPAAETRAGAPPALAAPPPPPPPPAPRETPRTPSARGVFRPHGGGVSVRAMGILGVLPAVAAAGAVALDGHVWGPIRWTAGAFLPAEVRTTSPNMDLGFRLIAGWAEACLETWPHDRLALAACAGGAVGVLSVRSDVTSPRRTTPSDALWAGPLLDLRATVPIVRPLVFEFGVQGVVAVANPSFAVEGHFPAAMPAMLFQPSTVVGTAYAGLGVQF
jgi:hypothetical protein